MRARSIVITLLFVSAMPGLVSCSDCGGSTSTGTEGETAELSKAAHCRFLLNAIKDLDKKIANLSQLAAPGAAEAIKKACDDRAAGVDLYEKEGCTAAELPEKPDACNRT